MMNWQITKEWQCSAVCRAWVCAELSAMQVNGCCCCVWAPRAPLARRRSNLSASARTQRTSAVVSAAATQHAWPRWISSEAAAQLRRIRRPPPATTVPTTTTTNLTTRTRRKATTRTTCRAKRPRWWPIRRGRSCRPLSSCYRVPTRFEGRQNGSQAGLCSSG